MPKHEIILWLGLALVGLLALYFGWEASKARQAAREALSSGRELNKMNDDLLSMVNSYNALIKRERAEWDRRWTAMFNRRVSVENILSEVAAGKRQALSPEQCRDLALRLGDPDYETRKELWQ